MKILRLFIVLTLVLFASSCSVKEDVTTVQVTVIDGRTGNTVPGATVSLFTTSGNNQLAQTTVNDRLTNTSGVTTFAVPFLSRYYVVAQSSTEKSYYGAGYIPIGYFKSQADIDNSPVQTPAGVVGGVKYQDTNGDGKIDAADIQLPAYAQLTLNQKSSITVTMY